MNDLRFAIRQLLKNPGFTAVAVLTLALGIGATTAIFNVGNALLLRPLPFKEPDQLFALTWQNPTNGNTTRQSFIHPVYEEYREQCRAFLDLIAYSGFSETTVHNGQSERIVGQLVSANFFSNLGITPILGRGFLPEDERSLNYNPIIISHGLWQRHFDSDTNVVGKSFNLGTSDTRTIHTVIGVAPSGLKDFPSGLWDMDVWTPMRLLPGRPFKGEFPIMARLNPAVSLFRAQVELDRITRHIEDLYRGGSVPGYENHSLLGLGNQAKLVPAGRGSWGPYVSSRNVWNLFALFMGAVGLVLLIACSNVANLLLVRAVKRRKEIAIRLALGASRVHLVRQLIVESLLLSFISGAVGLLMALWCNSLFQSLRPDSMVRVDLSPDIRMFSFALGLSVLTGLAFGLMPALQAVKFDLHPTLKEETLNLPGTYRGFSLRNLLVVTQVAVCLVLLVGAGLCLRNFWKLQAVDPGFRAENVLIVPLDLSEHNYSPASVVRLYTELWERLSLLPGVRHISFADAVPLTGASRTVGSPALIKDYVPQPGESSSLLLSEIGPGYFQALGIPLVQGREFTPEDRRGTPRVAIVNEALAHLYWPGQEPLGKRINYADGLEVIGVVKDLKFLRLWETPEPFFYMPMMQTQPYDGNLVIKTEGSPWPFLSVVRNQIQMLDKNLMVSRAQTLEQIRGSSLDGQRFTMVLLGLFAGMALLIAAVGLYGVVAHVTSQRTREIGVRMALGAGRGNVFGLVVRQGMGLVLVGIALGIAVAIGATRFLSGILHGVSPTDLATFFVVSLILALVALTACYLPARRAAKIDPMKALRHE